MPHDLPARLAWLKRIELLQRSVVSEGFEEALDIVAGEVGDGFKTHRFPCGSEAFTWIVPPRWRVRSATVRAHGEVLIDAANHPLHLLTHSIPFHGVVGREELLSHLLTNPRQPDAIPYQFSFYRPRWGFSIPHNWLPRFTAEQYEVDIDTELSNDAELVIGECTLPGRSSRTLILAAHLDHPGQIDDGMGGVAALIELIRRFRRNGAYDGFYTLTFLFTCETIGALCYLSRLTPSQENDLDGAIAPEALGKDVPLAFAQSYTGDTQLDRAAALVFKKQFGTYRREQFLSLVANDEQVFDGPGFLIPGLSIARYPYMEYHSSLDCVENFDVKRFDEAVDTLAQIVDLLNRNSVPHPLFRNIPCLSRYGLWYDWCDIPAHRNRLEALFRLLDGRHSIVDLATQTGLEYQFVREFLDGLHQHNLVRFEDPPRIRNVARK